MRKPTIPLSPTQLPKQRINALSDIAERPVPFDAFVGWGKKPSGVRLNSGPQNAEYLGQLEWSWSPSHSRLSAYYISRGRMHWLLWTYRYDDNRCKWDWLAVGHVLRRHATEKQAAIHLMADYWRMEKTEIDLDQFHWINEEGLLNASEWRTIALLVW